MVFPSVAGAAEVTRVVSGFQEGKRFDINVTLTWMHDQKQAIIKRESASTGSTSQIQLVKDLIYHQSRDIMNARLEMGILRDVGLHMDLPYVVRDDRELDFDQSAGSPCALSSAVGLPNCSTLIRDGILPGAGQTMYGVDATQGGRSFAASSSTLWKGPHRSGPRVAGVGVSGAIMNQARDDTKPTWTMGIDAQVRCRNDHALRRRQPRRKYRRRVSGITNWWPPRSCRSASAPWTPILERTTCCPWRSAEGRSTRHPSEVSRTRRRRVASACSSGSSSSRGSVLR